jgi:hypothetical protein
MRPDEIRNRIQSMTKGQAILGVIFGLVFFGIGISVMVFVWTASGFGAPPLFFRIVATLIAIPFVAVGGLSAYSSILVLMGNLAAAEQIANLLQKPGHANTQDNPSAGSGSRASYVCPSCGAPLSQGADVSPHGDVKCPHCARWFNVHKSEA